jgi:hypothetical protein
MPVIPASPEEEIRYYAPVIPAVQEAKLGGSWFRMILSKNMRPYL